MRKILLISILSIILLTCIVNAQISFSSLNSNYNFGDSLELSAVLKPSVNGEGFFTLNLVCQDKTLEFKKEYLNYAAGKEQNIVSKVTLNKAILGTLSGQCYVLGSYLDVQSQSSNFIISSNLQLSFSLDKINYNPGEKVAVSGKVLKSNGEAFSWNLEVSLKNTQISTSTTISSGNFNLNFALPSVIAAGDYEFLAKASDSNGNGGEFSKFVVINSIPTKLYIAIEKLNIVPGNNLTFKIILYDQTSKEMTGKAHLIIKDSKKEIYSASNLTTGTFYSYAIAKNMPAQEINLFSSLISGNISTNKIISIEKHAEIEIQVLGDELIVKSVWNIPYAGQINVKVGNSVIQQDVSLDLGEIKKYRINAPAGNYTILVNDAQTSMTKTNVSLTGNVIKLSEIKSTLFRNYVVWIFIIGIMGMFIFATGRKIIKKKSYTFPVSSFTPLKAVKLEREENLEKKIFEVKANVKEAEHFSVLEGHKEFSSLVTLSIKNLNECAKGCEETFQSIKETINSHNGAYYQSNGFIFGIFCPSVTKTSDNERVAIRIGEDINKIIKEHNSKFRIKIEYGISINSGEIITKKDGKLKFATMGTIMGTSKKIAEISSQEVLISDSVYRKLMSEIKAEKVDALAYRIKSFADRGQHSGFIQGFLDRQKK